MKRIVIIILGICLLAVNASGQWYNKYYPDRKLSELNNYELETLYSKANGLRVSGLTISVVGFGLLGAGSIIGVGAGMIDLISILATMETVVDPNIYNIALGLIIAGGAVLVVGIPLWSVGRSRTRDISGLPNLQSPQARIAILPSFQYIRGQNKFVPGLTFSLMF